MSFICTTARTLALSATVLTALLAHGQSWAGDEALVKPGGAALSFRGGAITALFPSGTFSKETKLVCFPNPLAPDSPFLLPGSAFTFAQAAMRFKKPVRMTVSYDPSSLPAGVSEADVRLYQVIGQKWELVGGTVDLAQHSVTVNLRKGGTFDLLSTTGGVAPENRIVYFGWLSGDDNAYSVSVNGWDREVLGPVFRNHFPPDLLPTLDAVVYGRVQPSNVFEGYLSSPDGGNPRRFTNLSITNSTGTGFNDEGSLLAISVAVGQTMKVMIVNLDGSGIRDLGAGGTTGHPVFNPAGTAIAFADNDVIRLVRVDDGSTIRTINTGLQNVTDLAYNPAGNVLAFKANDGLTSSAVFTVSPTNPAPPVKRTTGYDDGQPAWSPDGKQIAFFRQQSYNNGANPSGIYYINFGEQARDGNLVVSLAGGYYRLFWR